MKYTPMMQQYLSIKENYKDALVLYRLGDFYELFFEDAKIVSNELDLVLTGRSAGVEDKVPMCGVPHHAVSSYIQRLINKDYKIAIVEQLEDPSSATGIVKRDVVRVITPGTIIDELNDDKSSVYLAAIYDYQYMYALAVCEMASGDITLKTIKKTDIVTQLMLDKVKEVVVATNTNESLIDKLNDKGIVVSYCDNQEKSEYSQLLENLKEYYYQEVYVLLLNYLMATQKRTLDHLKQPLIEDKHKYLQMDYNTIINLELTELVRGTSRGKTLFDVLDQCESSIGSRLLQKWIEKPLYNLDEINKRQEAISYLVDNYIQREDLRKYLGNVYDLERIITKVAYGSCNGQDLIRLQKTLVVLPSIVSVFRNVKGYEYLNQLDMCTELTNTLVTSLNEQLPINLRDGGIFTKGYNQELDMLKEIAENGQKWIFSLEQTEREKTGIKNLKIGYNRVFGYYFEVSKGNLSLVKDEYGYIRKQTLTNAERFVSEELKVKEEEILHASNKALSLEYELYLKLISDIKDYLGQLQLISSTLAEIDCLTALAYVSSQSGYIRPIFTDGKMEIIAGKHPVLNEVYKKHQYIDNDAVFNDNTLMLITGPNMGGKSTYMRQIALLVIMAQIGCFVPAQSCMVPVIDRIYTRMGASDDITSGQSTFMVEMMEANNAITNATKESLIIFDEIGRGTSTYDGMALAQAIIEYIVTSVKCKALFSTHYHELTFLEEEHDDIINYHTSVYEKDGEITFLYKVIKGKANKSYGINVAKLANLPTAVIKRAITILQGIKHQDMSDGLEFSIMEESFPRKYQNIIEELEMVEVNDLTPLQALQLVHDLKKQIEE